MPTKSALAETSSVDKAAARTGAGTGAEQAYDVALQQEPERARTAVNQLREALIARRIEFGGAPLPTSIKPHFIRHSDNARWTSLLADLLVVLEKTAEQLRFDDEFRRNGPFTPDAWELLDIDPGYARPSVVCRPDLVWDGERISLLEMNADSPAMMLYADALQDLQRELFPMSDVERDHRLSYDQRVPALLRALLATYREWGGTASSPVVAIIDWRGQKTSSEQEQLAARFTALGCPSFTCAPDELELRGGRLYGRGEAIDIVQRRLLFPEIVKRRAEVEPLITAYRERNVCVVNPLRSYLVGCKAILSELCMQQRTGKLSAAMQEVVAKVLPCTANARDFDQRELQDRSRWVLKPAFGSGGAGVVIGRYADQLTWDQALRATRSGDWIAQTYLPIPLYRVPLTTAAGHATTPLYANWNPFFFGGVAAGGIARVSSDPVVGISARGALLPTIIVDGE